MFLAPPHDPLHAHSSLAHVGPDVMGDFPWAVKNTVCAQAGENDPMKWGTGRFHVEHDPAKGMFGHAPMQE